MPSYKDLMPSLNPLQNTIKRMTEYTLPNEDLNSYANRAQSEASNQTTTQRQSLNDVAHSLSNQRNVSVNNLNRNTGLLPAQFMQQLRNLQNNASQQDNSIASSGQGLQAMLSAGINPLQAQGEVLQQAIGQRGQIENEYLNNLMSQVYNPQRQLASQQGEDATNRYQTYINEAQKSMFEGRVSEAENLLSQAQLEYNSLIKAEEERFLNQQMEYQNQLNSQQQSQQANSMSHASLYKGGGSVDDWLTQAIRVTGVPMSWLEPLRTIAMKESSGNPNAQNNWDVNAKRGTPSIGLMQTISPTFNAHKSKGMDDIRNPVHNAVAAINYIKSRYGTPFNTPGIKSMASGGKYKGY